MTEADAIVVGAGPAGASAAYHLARQGRRVLLLERARFPRDKSCGDALTRYATRQLAEMGVLDLLPEAALFQGVRVYMRGRSHRDFRYLHDPDPRRQGLIVPRVVLDHAICRRAVAAGAVLWEETLATGLLRDAEGVVGGVTVQREGASVELRARVVVAADGAASRLSRQAGLYASRPDETGYAIRGYYEGIEGLEDLLEIHMPLLDSTDRYLLPSYGWAFPIGPTSANLGVGLVHRERGANVRELLGRFLESLRADPRFAAAQPCGEWRGAPLRFDFQPQRCAAPGLLLAGDAAGMISPFTGEGISYALASGRLAAEAVHRGLAVTDEGPLELLDYSSALARRFTGYFEAGRESVLRYKLIWHLLENTFQNDKPLFDICRRAALFPEGIGQSYVHEAFEDVGPTFRRARGAEEDAAAELAGLRADLIGVGEVLLGTVRENWPFLARVLAVEETVSGIPFRPALLLLLAGRVSGSRRSICIPLAAAVEMGFIAALSHASVVEDGADGPVPANWGNRVALMVGDFLLGNAYAVSADIAAEASREVAAAVSTAAEGHLRALRHAYDTDLTPDDYRAIAEAKAGTLFELPCRLGARIAGAPPRVVAALAAYGRRLGLAYQLMHDLSVEEGWASELGRAVGSSPSEGIYPFATIHALQTDQRERLKRALAAERAGAGGEEVAALVRAAGGPEAAVAEALRNAEAAKQALRSLPEGLLLRWFEALADSVCARHRGVPAEQEHCATTLS